MAGKVSINKIKDFASDCIQCGICLDDCSLLNDLGMTPGEIALNLVQGEIDGNLINAIQRCALCGKCSQNCLVNLNPAEMIREARELLMEKGLIQPEAYDVMLVDRQWNFFSIYNDTFDIKYDDLKADDFDVLFFPGCTLSSYSPELTRATFDWLQKSGLNIGFSNMCCGKPLDSIGLSHNARKYLEPLHRQLEIAGAKEIITACPNCESNLKHHFPNMKVRSLYKLMVDSGIELTGNTSLTFHDSCPDRYDSRNPQFVREILSGYPQFEMTSRGQNTICCGSGGIVSMVDPDLCNERALCRMAEFDESGAETCITNCMACAHRLARVSRAGKVRHCLELVFGIQIDYQQVEENTRAMWEGPAGEINIMRLSQVEASQPGQD